MTPQPKSRTIGQWLVLDDKGDTWRVQCLACNRKESFSRYLLGAIAPRCKCGGKVARPQIPPPAGFVPSKPEPADLPELDPILPFGPADNPVDKIASPPVADALFGIFGMVPVKADKPKPEPKPKAVKTALIGKRPDHGPDAEPAPVATPLPIPFPVPRPDKRQRRQPPPVYLGKIAGTHWTVLSEVTSISNDNRTTVFARCVCGKERNVVWCSIWIGKSKSCGCLRAKALVEARKLKPNTVGLPGMEYGAMTVQSEGPRRGRLRTVWCLCGICKTTRLITVQDLRQYRGQTCSCAVAHRRDRETRKQRQARMAVITAARVAGQRVRKIELLTAQIARLQDELARLQSPPTVAQ